MGAGDWSRGAVPARLLDPESAALGRPATTAARVEKSESCVHAQTVPEALAAATLQPDRDQAPPPLGSQAPQEGTE